ncbi:putative translational activator [Cyclospora cayetanensis]|uniref:Translational activator n=1 Tax=Cyclospora cayetanensis TaxID=88456 RepID=A0A1D3CUS1_9EIME|nr:putative translational activator [Cyclospora cayetanensis]
MTDASLQEGRGDTSDVPPPSFLTSLEALSDDKTPEQQCQLLQQVVLALQERSSSRRGGVGPPAAPSLSQEEFKALCASLLLSPDACSNRKRRSSSWRCCFSQLRAVAAKVLAEEQALSPSPQEATESRQLSSQPPLLQQFCAVLQEPQQL